MIQTGQCPTCRAVNSYAAITCIECGARLPWADAVQAAQHAAAQAASQATAPPTAMPTAMHQAPAVASGGLNAMQIIGGLLLAVAALGAVYFFLIFDTSVSAGAFGRVNNIGLLADRQNGILISIGAAIVGAILLAIGAGQSRNQATPVVEMQGGLSLFTKILLGFFAVIMLAIVCFFLFS